MWLHCELVLIALVVAEAQGPASYDCDFEKDACGWTEDTDNYLMRWVRKGAGNPMQGTGPVVDGSGDRRGHFMNVHVTQGEKVATVTLKSPRLPSVHKSSSCQMQLKYSLSIPRPYHCQNEMGDSGCLDFADTKELQEEFCRDEPDFSAENCAKMCGMKCGHLSVFVSDQPSLKGTQIYHLRYSNFEMWTAASINISASLTGKPMWVMIQAETGWDRNSYIALDDVTFSNCGFNVPITSTASLTSAQKTAMKPTLPTPNAGYPTTARLNGSDITLFPVTQESTLTLPATSAFAMTAAVSFADCDFNASLCEWKSEIKTFEWKLNRNGDPLSGTGPAIDGSGNKNGSFIVMMVKSKMVPSPTRLVSTKAYSIHPANAPCQLSFQYNSYAPSFLNCVNAWGDAECNKQDLESDACQQPGGLKSNCSKSCGISCANLKVYVTNDLTKLGRAVFFLRYPKDTAWYTQVLNISGYANQPFWVIFEAVNGLDIPAYIALDNIKFLNCVVAATAVNSSFSDGPMESSPTSQSIKTPLPERGPPPRPESQKSQSNEKSERSSSTLPITIGVVGGLAAVGSATAGVIYHIHRKKMQALRGVSPDPLGNEEHSQQQGAREAWR